MKVSPMNNQAENRLPGEVIVPRRDLELAMRALRALKPESTTADTFERALAAPASDLEQVTRERDEAVRLLRGVPVVLLDRAVVGLRDEPVLRSYIKSLAEWGPKAKAFLNTLDNRND